MNGVASGDMGAISDNCGGEIDANGKAGVQRTPHPDGYPFIPWVSREELYNGVVRMYLDCQDDEEVAREVSGMFGVNVTGAMAHLLRREAAACALKERRPEVRKLWIYRYKRLTVNNLVKEYMFLEGDRDFLASKVKLAHELYQIVEHTPQDRIWIAVNEAVGRNNVDISLVDELVAYGATAARVNELINNLAQVTGKDLDAQMEMICLQVRMLAKTAQSDEALAESVAKLFMDRGKMGVTAEDVCYIKEYDRFIRNGLSKDATIVMEILYGADLEGEDLTLMECIMAGLGDNLSVEEFAALDASLRRDPVHAPAELYVVHEYVSGRLDLTEARSRGIPGSVSRAESVMADVLRKLFRTVADHLDIVDFKRFYTAEEAMAARAKRVPDSQLQAGLDRLNRLADREAVARVLKFLGDHGDGRLSSFPAARYMSKRFGST